MQHQKINTSLLVITLILSALLLYMLFDSQRDVRKAVQSISTAQESIENVRDSLLDSQKLVQQTLSTISLASVQIDLLKKERESLIVDLERRLALNRNERKRLEQQLAEINAQLELIKAEAEKFVP